MPFGAALQPHLVEQSVRLVGIEFGIGVAQFVAEELAAGKNGALAFLCKTGKQHLVDLRAVDSKRKRPRKRASRKSARQPASLAFRFGNSATAAPLPTVQSLTV